MTQCAQGESDGICNFHT